MLFIAVTGGIGSGKSAVAAHLRTLGAVIADSDALSRAVVAPGTPGLMQIRERFGTAVMAPDGSLDRSALAAVVFADRQARADLEKIVHPRVRAAVAAIRSSASEDSVVVNDIPLLVDLDQVAEYQLVVGIGATESTRLSRLIERGLGESDARARMAVQISDDRRRFLADEWLDNDGSLADLQRQVEHLWSERIEVFLRNLLGGRPAAAMMTVDGEHRAALVARTVARVQRAVGGERPREVEPGPRDQIRLEVVLPETSRDLGLAARLARAGMVSGPPSKGSTTMMFVGADPATAVLLTVRSAAD